MILRLLVPCCRQAVDVSGMRAARATEARTVHGGRLLGVRRARASVKAVHRSLHGF